MNHLSGPTESFLSVIDKGLSQCIDFKQSTLNRCSLLIAVFDKGIWRLRFRLVVTPKSGLLIFPLTQTLNIFNGKITVPEESNTIAIIGFILKKSELVLQMRVHANESGEQICDVFNGYKGNFKIDISGQQHKLTIDDALQSSPDTKRFNRKLYTKSCSAPLSEFKVQHSPAIFEAPSLDSIHENW